MATSLTGFNDNTATFKISGEVDSGIPVTMESNCTVKPCSKDDNFIGQTTSIRDSFAGVQLTGYAVFTYTGTAPTVGYCTLAGDGNNGITVSESGKSYLVIDVDDITKTVGIILG